MDVCSVGNATTDRRTYECAATADVNQKVKNVFSLRVDLISRDRMVLLWVGVMYARLRCSSCC